jgi:glycosyltransferase involved in cell wall biosynthesis
MSRQCHILIDGLNLAWGGGVVVMSRLAGAFARAGWKVTVLTSRPLFEIHSPPQGVEVILRSQAAGAARSILYRRLHLSNLCQYLGCDVLLSFNYFSPVAIPQVTYHINVIPFLPIHERVRSVGLLRALLQGHLSRLALLRSHLNLFESHFVQGLSGIPEAAETVLYVGIDKPPTELAKRNAKDLTLVSVTSGAPHKRNDQTLSLFRAWSEEHTEARLVFIGNEVTIRESLSPVDREFADTNPNVSFTGYLSRDELYVQLSSAYAMVISSTLESFFMVALEGMAAGCPVVAADMTSARESLADAGLLIPEGNVEAGVDALNSLTGNARNTLIAKGYARSISFDALACADAFVQNVERFTRGKL